MLTRFSHWRARRCSALAPRFAALTAMAAALCCLALPATATESAATARPAQPAKTAAATAPATPTSTTPAAAPLVQVRWAVGDTRRYVLTKTRARARNDLVEQAQSSDTPIDVQVLAVNGEQSVLAWRYGETRLDDAEAAANPMVRQMSNLMKGLTLELVVAHDRGVVGLRNWRDVQTLMDKVLTDMGTTLRSNGMTDAAVAGVMQQVRPMFATEAQMVATSTREAQLMFSLLGKPVGVNQPFSYDTALPNALGGEAIPGRGEYQVMQQEGPIATIGWQQKVDSAAFQRIMSRTLTDMATRMGKPTANIGETLANLTVDDRAEFKVDLRSGWPTAVTHIRRTGSSLRSQTDTTSLVAAP
ncbi:MAG: hypothetical protein CFE46_10940 [Burkholderiales bacterium PBB6]|nr:MAG: hypothetical protein CFE46_10940 [Burkholderiales bacterium PBB6]